MNITIAKVTDYGSTRIIVLVLIVSSMFVTAWLSITGDLFFRFTNDGIGYIEEAGNFLEGRGLVRTPSGSAPLDQDYIREGIFPPGFSLLLAALGQLGVHVETAAILIPVGAWILLPVIYIWTFSPLLPLRRVTVVAALFAFSPGIVLAGGDVLSDIPFLALCLVAFGYIVRSFSSNFPLRYAFVAGAILGLSYWLRYAATALVMSFFIALTTVAILRFEPRRAVLYRLLAMFGGCAPILAALLIRNYTVFGTLQPYVSPTSPFFPSSLIAVSRGYFSDLLIDVSGFRIAGLLAWDIKLFLLIVVPLIIYVGWLIWRQAASSSNSAASRVTILVLCLYLCAGSTMVILTKVRYGAVDELRYVLQYSWIILTLLALTLIPRMSLQGRIGYYAVLLSIIVLMLGRASFAWQLADKEHRIQALSREYADWRSVAKHLPDPNWVLTNQIKIDLARNADLTDAITRLPPQAYIISNMAGVLKEATKRPIRNLEADSPEEIARALAHLSDAVNAVHTARPIYCVIAPTNRLVKIKGERSWIDTLTDVLPADYVTVWRQDDILILHYQPQITSAKAPGAPSGTVSHDL